VRGEDDRLAGLVRLTQPDAALRQGEEADLTLEFGGFQTLVTGQQHRRQRIERRDLQDAEQKRDRHHGKRNCQADTPAARVTTSSW
jgi:hypothetical protein